MAHFEENQNQKQKSEFESEAEVRSRNQNQKSESEISCCVSCGQSNNLQWQQRAVRTGIHMRLVRWCVGSGPSTRRHCARASVCAFMQDAPTDAGRPNNAGRPHRRSNPH